MDECFFLARVCLAGINSEKNKKSKDLIVKKEIPFSKKNILDKDLKIVNKILKIWMVNSWKIYTPI